MNFLARTSPAVWAIGCVSWGFGVAALSFGHPGFGVWGLGTAVLAGGWVYGGQRGRPRQVRDLPEWQRLLDVDALYEPGRSDGPIADAAHDLVRAAREDAGIT